MMQKTFPILKPGRFTKTDRVILERSPTYKKYVFVLNLEATPELMRDVTGGMPRYLWCLA